MKGLDKYQLETFLNNMLYVLDVIYFSVRALKRNEKIPEDMRKEIFSLPHPKKDRLRFGEIQRMTRFSTRTVSKHLERLRKIGLVVKLNGGYYTLSEDIFTKEYDEYKKFKSQIKEKIKDLIEVKFEK